MTTTIDGIDIPFINLEDLILDKQTNARLKDIIDIEQLKEKLRKGE